MLNKNAFVAYEYRTVSVKKEMADLYMDCYQNFGWISDKAPVSTIGSRVVTIKFKRKRQILNKAELTRLQRHFDANVSEIIAMEQAKSEVATIISIAIGIVGCAFMAGSVFSITGNTSNYILCSVLAVPGFISWIIPYFCYRWIQRRKTDKMNPLIEKKYEELYEVCEKANRLMIE